MIINKTHDLYDIYTKVIDQKELNRADGLKLYESKDLLTIGYLANIIRERLHGNNTYFISNQHLNYTNICVTECKLCAFGVKKEHTHAYAMDLKEIETRAINAKNYSPCEFHIVGGMNPDLTFDYYINMLKKIKEVLPSVHIKAFTAAEVDYFSKETKMSLIEVLKSLQNAGLDSLPGGGAEIFSERVRQKICPNKITGTRWLEVHEAVHSIGMRSNATMLYGHVETVAERVEHLLLLRELQHRTNGFLAFIPLAFHPTNTELFKENCNMHKTTGFDDLKTLAISRLLLSNIKNIKSYWVMVGEKIAQVSLHFGVDDLDGTIVEERITYAAGGESKQAMTKNGIIKLIKDAGRTPVERDTYYNPIVYYDKK